VGKTFERESQVLPVTFDALLEELCTVSLSTAVAGRRDLIDAGLFDESLVRCEYFDLWLRMAYRGTGMTHHSGANVCRTLSPNGLSSNQYLMRCARLEVLNKVGATMSLSGPQQELLARRQSLAEAMVNVDRLKLLIEAGRFPEAMEAASQAYRVLHGWKLRLAIFGLRRAPRVVKGYYKVHARLLAIRNRRRLNRSSREVQAGADRTTGRPVTRDRYGKSGAVVN